MALTLFIKADFLYSDFVPPVCFFSGRRENLQVIGYKVQVPREGGGCLDPIFFLNFVLFFLRLRWVDPEREPQPLPFMANSKGYFRWRLAQNAWIAGFVGLLIGGCVASIFIGEPGAEAGTKAWAVGAIAALFLITAGSFVAGRLATPSIKMVSEKEVRLRWPTSMQATYDAYLDGFFEYSQDQELARKRVRTSLNSKLKYTRDDEESPGETWTEGESAAVDETTEAGENGSESEDTDTESGGAAESDSLDPDEDGERGD